MACPRPASASSPAPVEHSVSRDCFGFVGVPVFSFWAPNWPVVGEFLGALGELPPSFLLSGVLAIVVSLADRAGRARLEGIEQEL